MKFYFILEHIFHNFTSEKENIADENSTDSGIGDAVVCKGKDVISYFIVTKFDLKYNIE